MRTLQRSTRRISVGARTATSGRSTLSRPRSRHPLLPAFPVSPSPRRAISTACSPQWGDLIDYVIPSCALPGRAISLSRMSQPRPAQAGTDLRTIEHRLVWQVTRNDGFLSPHHFGVPQIRERAFIVGRRGGLEGFSWPQPALRCRSVDSLNSDEDLNEAKPLPTHFLKYLKAWQRSSNAFRRGDELRLSRSGDGVRRNLSGARRSRRTTRV